MLFTNNPVETVDLPRFEDQEFKPLKKQYRTLILMQWTIFTLFPISGILILYFLNPIYSIQELLFVLSGVVLFYIFQVVLNIIGFRRKGYALREHDILYRTGLIVQKTIAIPYNRIQHSEIRQGVLSRILSISKLKIYTAGGNASDLSVNGLSPDDAQSIKDFFSKMVSSYE